MPAPTACPPRRRRSPGNRLIHLEEPYRPCVDWTDWLAGGRRGRRPPAAGAVSVRAADHGLLINDYVLVIQAVLEGQGIRAGLEAP